MCVAKAKMCLKKLVSLFFIEGLLQLRPFTSYKYLENPIYRMYNPIYNQL